LRFWLCEWPIVVGLFQVGKFDVHSVKLVGIKTNTKQYIVKIKEIFREFDVGGFSKLRENQKKHIVWVNLEEILKSLIQML